MGAGGFRTWFLCVAVYMNFILNPSSKPPAVKWPPVRVKKVPKKPSTDGLMKLLYASTRTNMAHAS